MGIKVCFDDRPLEVRVAFEASSGADARGGVMQLLKEVADGLALGPPEHYGHHIRKHITKVETDLGARVVWVTATVPSNMSVEDFQVALLSWRTTQVVARPATSP